MPIETRRGIRLPHLKEPAASREVARLEAKGPLSLPLAYDEQGGTPICAPREIIRKGQPVALCGDSGCLPVHAGVTGTLEGTRTVSHPLYGRIDCAVIGCPAGETEEPDALPADLGRLSPDSVIETALHAGLIDVLDGVPLLLMLSQG